MYLAAMAFLYHSLTMLLLASSRPHFSGIGEEDTTAQYETEQQCLKILNRVCGVAQAHPGTTLCLATLALSHSKSSTTAMSLGPV